jgi:hypothetical protein
MKAPLEKPSAELSGRAANPVVCSAVSRQAGEQLAGSVSRTGVWFLLEYREPFGAKAFEESGIPAGVKAHLNGLLETVPASRLLLIRGTPARAGREIAFFVANSREESPAVYEWQLPDYEALLGLELDRALAGNPAVESHRRQEPLFLVCTNGRRDPCCARWGQPVFDRLVRNAGERVWQTSHVGGHRFAANVLCFPHGLYFGRIDPGEAEALTGAYQGGQILLPNFRGRACYPAEVQAAEFFLRTETGDLQVDSYRLESNEPSGPGAWEIRFRARTGETVYRLDVDSEPAPGRIYESCTAAEPVVQTRYSLGRLAEISSGEDRT